MFCLIIVRGDPSGDLQMVTCLEYDTKSGIGSRGAQPFTVSASHPALSLMDFHAHLCDHEIIGLLGGTFDAANRSLRCAEGAVPRDVPSLDPIAYIGQ
jgi:hypothetical protein